ncbi:MAG: single-stranded-DNA-specific exonuclease RecJ, partial [Phototrophicales bacterium]
MIQKRWIIAPPASKDHLYRFRGMSPFLAQILINRGYNDPKDAQKFLYSKDITYNPYDMPDMEKAVKRIQRAIHSGEKIIIYGDFDADGVTSTTLMMQALQALGANVKPYIPHRVDEGYGLNTPALLKLAKAGVSLVITVDCGIRSLEEVAQGTAAGLDIIITDHHSLGPELPDAYAVINCKRPGYPEPMLAGVGVAFKLVQALIMAERTHKQNGHGKYAGVPLHDLFDLVALGTVADLMPLNHLENRVLVRRGLEVLN